MHAIVQWLANLKIKRNMTPMFVNKKHRYMVNYVRVVTSISETEKYFEWIITFSIYTLSDLGVLSNLIGSLSLANEHCSPPTEWIICKPNKNKLAGVNAWIERSIKSIFIGFLLKMLLRSHPVYILKQLFFSISVNSAEYLPHCFADR